MPAKWRIAIPLAVVVLVLVGASVWMFAKDDDGGGKGKGANGGGGAAAAATSSTIPGQGKDPGQAAPYAGEVTIYGVPSSRGALNGLAQGFEAANPDATVNLVIAPLLDLVEELVGGAQPGVLVAPPRAMDAIKGVSDDIGTAEDLGRNLFILAVPKGNPKGIDGLDALAADSGLRVTACGPDSPFGNFAQIVIDSAEVAVADGLAKSGCGNAAVAQVGAGDLDAALVMRSGKDRTVQSVPIPEDDNVIIPFLIAKVVDDPAGDAVISYAKSEAGASILTDRGFLP